MTKEPLTASSRQMADMELASRSKLSGLVYIALYGIFLAFTPYAHDHPLLAVLIGGLVLLSATLRSWLAFNFDRLYQAYPGRWVTGFIQSSYLLAGTWGMLCSHTLLNYGLDWTAMLAVLSTAGICAGAITILTIRKSLIMGFLALILLPPIIAAALLDSRESYAISLMFLTYFIFMLSIARNIHRDYWSALENSRLLDQHTRALEVSNRELESYSYSIAHDLRAPLRAIIGFSQILRETLGKKLTPGEQEDLDRIVHAGKHMAKLIDDILELSRITRRKLQRSEINLSELVQDRADALLSIEPARSVAFSIEPGLCDFGDPQLLSLAIQNLMENAWKFTGNVERAEIVFDATKKNGELVYRLCDNGVGFDMAHAKKLFKPFDRLHSQAEYPGTGIGLATVERIVTRHGGRIWAESGVNKGACFYFTLQGHERKTLPPDIHRLTK